jgi:hypothetical protein
MFRCRCRVKIGLIVMLVKMFVSVLSLIPPAVRKFTRKNIGANVVCAADCTHHSIVVFGASGTCGRAVVSALQSQSAGLTTKIFGVVRNSTKGQFLPSEVQMIHCDMVNQDAVHTTLRRAKTLNNGVNVSRLSIFISSSNGPQQAQVRSYCTKQLWLLLFPFSTRILSECLSRPSSTVGAERDHGF